MSIFAGITSLDEDLAIAEILSRLRKRRLEVEPSYDVRISVAELQLTESDVQFLGTWLKHLDGAYVSLKLVGRRAWSELRASDWTLSYGEAIALVCIVTISELIRRGGIPDETAFWAGVKKLFGSTTGGVLFLWENPRQDFKDKLEEAFRSSFLGFRHRFDDPNTKHWYSSFMAQFGLSRGDLPRLRSYLILPMAVAAVPFLRDSSERFRSFWRVCDRLRRGTISTREARTVLEANAFVLPEWIPEIFHALAARRGSLKAVDNLDLGALLGEPLFAFASDGGLSFEIAIYHSAVAAILPRDTDPRVLLNDRDCGLLLSTGDGTRPYDGPAMIRVLWRDARPTMRVRFDTGDEAVERDTVLWGADDLVAGYDLTTQQAVDLLSPMNLGHRYAMICHPDLLPSHYQSFETQQNGWRVFVVESEHLLDLRVIDQEGDTYWRPALGKSGNSTADTESVATLSVPDGFGPIRLLAPAPIEVELTVSGELVGARIGGVRYPVDGADGSYKLRDVRLSTQLASSEVTSHLTIRNGSESHVYRGRHQLPIQGCLVDRQAEWAPIAAGESLSVEDTNENRLHFFIGKMKSGHLFDGNRHVTAVNEHPLRLPRRLDGLGESLWVRDALFNSEESFEVARTVVQTGIIRQVEVDVNDQPTTLRLRYPNDLIGYSLLSWNSIDGLTCLSAEACLERNDHDGLAEFTIRWPDSVRHAQTILALEYAGSCEGAWFSDRKEAWNAGLVKPQGEASMLGVLRWCRLPFLNRTFSNWFANQLQSEPLNLVRYLNPEPLTVADRTLKESEESRGSIGRGLRRLLREHFPAFAAKFEAPEWLAAYCNTPTNYNTLRKLHPRLARRVYRRVTNRQLPARPEHEPPDQTLRDLHRELGLKVDSHFLLQRCEAYLSVEQPTERVSDDIHMLLSIDAFRKWFCDEFVPTS